MIKYKQIIWLSPTSALPHHSLLSITKIRYFPLADIGMTLYMYIDNDSTFMVPIGYANYCPD